MTTWTHEKVFFGRGSEAEEGWEKDPTVSIQSPGAAYDAGSVEPAVSNLVQAAPSWRALHSHPPRGIKTYKSSNVLSSVQCSVTTQPNIVLSFSCLPQPVLGPSGPRALHRPSAALQRRVTSAGCVSQFLKVS